MSRSDHMQCRDREVYAPSVSTKLVTSHGSLGIYKYEQYLVYNNTTDKLSKPVASIWFAEFIISIIVHKILFVFIFYPNTHVTWPNLLKRLVRLLLCLYTVGVTFTERAASRQNKPPNAVEQLK